MKKILMVVMQEMIENVNDGGKYVVFRNIISSLVKSNENALLFRQYNVMPIFYGAGQKIKTVEAMMYGKLILATNEALEGYAVTGIKGIYRCNTVRDFIEAIKNITYSDIVVARKRIRQLLVEKYSYSSVLGNVKPYIDI